MEHKFGGPWTKIKLDMLDSYLKAYVNVFKNMQWCYLIYLDAFAGNGECHTTDGVINGSAKIALENPRFNEYIFIEQNPDHIEQLKALQKEFIHKKITILQGNCNKLIQEIVNKYDWKKCRAVAFLDPYAMELKFDTLIHLANTKVFDIWYLFPLSSITRTLPNSGHVKPNASKLVSELLGNIDWETELYEPSPQINLFEMIDNEQNIQRKDQQFLCCYFQKRLKTVFPTVSCPVCLKNSNNTPMFLLYFLVSNQSKSAQKIANSIASYLIEKERTYVCKQPRKKL